MKLTGLEKGIIALVIAGGITTYIVLHRKKANKQIKQINDILDAKVKDPNAGGQKIISSTAYSSLPDGTFPLVFGSASKKMYDLQMNANRNYGSALDVDGKYGVSTWDFMCKNVWSSWYKVGECYDYHLTSAPTRRSITQADFEAVKARKQSSSFDGQKIDVEKK